MTLWPSTSVNLVNSQSLQEAAAQETVKNRMQPADGIRFSTRMQLELRTGINVFKAMKLNPPNEKLLPSVIKFYEQKIELHDALMDISTQFISGTPKAGVDYDKLAATAPKITANLDFIDKTLLSTSPLFFALLIDEKPDKQGHMSRLSITKEQRKRLVDMIDSLFGSSLKAKNQNYTVSQRPCLRHIC